MTKLSAKQIFSNSKIAHAWDVYQANITLMQIESHTRNWVNSNTRIVKKDAIADMLIEMALRPNCHSHFAVKYGLGRTTVMRNKRAFEKYIKELVIQVKRIKCEIYIANFEHESRKG